MPQNHVEELDGCDHGHTGKVCKPDPQPEHGQECAVHGNHGGVNEDHCDTTTTTTTTAPPTTTTTVGSVSPTTTTTTKDSTPQASEGGSPSTTAPISTLASPEPSVLAGTTTSVAVPALPVTGFDSGLGGLGVALVLIGVALRRWFGGAR